MGAGLSTAFEKGGGAVEEYLKFNPNDAVSLCGVIKAHLSETKSSKIQWHSIADKMQSEKWTPARCQAVWRYCAYPSHRKRVEALWDMKGGDFVELCSDDSDVEEAPQRLCDTVAPLRTAAERQVIQPAKTTSSPPAATKPAGPVKSKSGDAPLADLLDKKTFSDNPKKRKNLEKPVAASPTNVWGLSTRQVYDKRRMWVNRSGSIKEYSGKYEIEELREACEEKSIQHEHFTTKEELLLALQGIVPRLKPRCAVVDPQALQLGPLRIDKAKQDNIERVRAIEAKEKEPSTPERPTSDGLAGLAKLAGEIADMEDGQASMSKKEVVVPSWIRATFVQQAAQDAHSYSQNPKWTPSKYSDFLQWADRHREAALNRDWTSAREQLALDGFSDMDLEMRLSIPMVTKNGRAFKKKPENAGIPKAKKLKTKHGDSTPAKAKTPSTPNDQPAVATPMAKSPVTMNKTKSNKSGSKSPQAPKVKVAAGNGSPFTPTSKSNKRNPTPEQATEEREEQEQGFSSPNNQVLEHLWYSRMRRNENDPDTGRISMAHLSGGYAQVPPPPLSAPISPPQVYHSKIASMDTSAPPGYIANAAAFPMVPMFNTMPHPYAQQQQMMAMMQSSAHAQKQSAKMAPWPSPS